MPDWTDLGLVLTVRKQAETNAVVTFFTQNHGRLNGLCKSAMTKTNAALFQVGNLLKIHWNARLEEHLGTVKADPVASFSAPVLSDALRLETLSSVCALPLFLPEREADAALFEKTTEVLALLETENFLERYARWEVDLLSSLGFGLDLSACAITGQSDDLAYVSPKSGRAVSRAAGLPWKGRLLDLPDFLLSPDKRPTCLEDVKKALKLSGFFLENYAAKTIDYPIPAARKRLIERVMVLV